MSFPLHSAECLSLQSGPIASSQFHNTVKEINKTDEHPDSVQLINTLIRVIPGTYLVLGSINRIGEGKERQGKVHETILVGLDLLVTLNDLEQLQTHQADHCSCRRGDGRNDLSSNELALYERETNKSHKYSMAITVHVSGKGSFYSPCVCLLEECHNSLPSD